MNLEITCKAVDSIVAYGSDGDLTVELNNVSPDFIEQLEIRDIMMYADNDKLMKGLDYNELADFLETNNDVKIVDNSDV